MCQKIPYSTKKLARNHIKSMRSGHIKKNKQQQNALHGKKFLVYKCFFCDYYHLTTTRKRKKL